MTKKLLHLINFRDGIIFDVAVVLICCLSFGFSWIESTVNMDSHHWGFMYTTALDIKRGLIPYKDTYIQYGYLTNLIQALSLNIFGERLKSIGIITGIFYSFSLFFSYKIFLTFLPKYLSYFVTFLIFLLHPYIIYPWSNYYSYTFLLISVFLFIKERKVFTNLFISGLFLGLSVLCRYSLLPIVLPPFLIFLIYEFLVQKNSRKFIFKKFAFFNLGFIVPLVLFWGFLLYYQIYDDFLVQNTVALEAHGAGNITSLLSQFLETLITAKTEIGIVDIRSFLFTINFFWCLLVLLYLLYKSLIKKENLNKSENLVIIISLVTLFGYLSSVPLSAVFRLVNASSLGIGIIAYTLMQVGKHIQKSFQLLLILPVITLCFILANSLIFTKTSSTYLPWNKNLFTGRGIATTEIQIFQGKLLSPDYYNFYDEIFQKLSKFDSSYSIINYTLDPIAMMLNDLPRIHHSPLYSSYLQEAFPYESEKIQQSIDSHKAIILSSEALQIPGYKIIFHKPYPNDSRLYKEELYIYVPDKIA